MKTLPFIALFAVLTLTSSYVSSKIDASAETATTTGLFKQFQIHRQSTDVALTWSVSKPGVTEFAVERSYDNANFETIGSMPCSGTATHTYTDVSVSPGTVYYRIYAIKANQSVQSSVTESVRIISGS